jgi:hypothetical protein
VHSSTHAAAPSPAKLPRGQGAQVARVTAPMAVENVPNGHRMHTAASINGEYFPEAHRVQLLPQVPLPQRRGGAGGSLPTHS